MARKEETRPFYKDPKFIKERRKWYAKLKKKGFRDIEYELGDSGEGNFLVGPNPMDILKGYSADKQRYYELARQHYWDMVEGKHPKRECKIWGLHADGKSQADIVADTKISRHYVAKTINEQRKAMFASREVLDSFDEETLGIGQEVLDFFPYED